MVRGQEGRFATGRPKLGGYLTPGQKTLLQREEKRTRDGVYNPGAGCFYEEEEELSTGGGG